MNFKRKLLIIFLISFNIIIPFNVLAYTKYLIPGGENVGINVSSDGVFIVGFYKVKGVDIGKKANLQIGDRIVSINDILIEDINDLVNNFNSNTNKIKIKLGYIRHNKLNYTTMELEKDLNGAYKTGLYVKDSITGIGTITFINPEDNSFCALGHEIVETNSNLNFTLLKGNIFQASITSITKSSIGSPGEKNATLNTKEILGHITLNKETGIYGKLNKNINDSEVMEVGNFSDVKIGKAEIITVINDNKKERFAIEILSIDPNNDTKNFLIQITDKRLLDQTGGIVKGMSGSPIIQNNMIIGALTHAIIDNPTKGYGIGIAKMLEQKE